MSEWSGLFKAIASLDSKLDQAMGVPAANPSDAPDPTPISVVEDFDFPPEVHQFLEIYEKRFTSMSSKIKHLATENERLLNSLGPDPAAATAKKIDLLMDEGRRLSAQELKLNTTIRKLRKDLQGSADQGDKDTQLTTALSELETTKNRSQAQIAALDTELEALKKQHKQTLSELDLKNAQVERYKAAAPLTTPIAGSDDKLKELQLDYENARNTWSVSENKLLQNIASLEENVDTRDKQIAELKPRITELQSLNQELRDLAEQHKISLNQSQSQHESLQLKYTEHESQLDELRQTVETLQQSKADLESQVADANNKIEQQQKEIQELHSQPPQPSPLEAPIYDDLQPPPLEAFEEPEPEPQTPHMPDHIDPDHSGFESPSRGFGVSNLTSSVGGGSVDVDPHIVAKLNQTNRKLEAQLLMVQESLEKARKEKDEACSELIKYMSASDDQGGLEQKNKELEEKVNLLLVKLGQKSEQVNELQADVADLKDMYKEQVSALIEQIEGLKK